MNVRVRTLGWIIGWCIDIIENGKMSLIEQCVKNTQLKFHPVPTHCYLLSPSEHKIGQSRVTLNRYISAMGKHFSKRKDGN